MKPIRILLADDHALVRAGIRSLLEKNPDFAVVAEATTGQEALELIRSTLPAIVLMDIAMSGGNGLEAATRAIKEFPSLKVIILSMHSNEEYVLEALRAGATGYMLKDAATAELDLAIHAVARNETYLSPAVSKQVIDRLLQRSGYKKTSPPPLTTRQREILQLITEGKTTKEIAFVLGLSIKTVESHRAQIMERLNIHDIPGLVRYAMKFGITS